MAKSKARKQREGLTREGRMDPALLRGTWGGIDPTTRRTPTKKELLRRLEQKHKGHWGW
jgi:hypothetical protein